ncbi:MAG TPA: exodeoxyribonuclease VII large subunit, partial [Burkholderiaceae bacterium]|nr:exodeoxyribonuclease VII large subunit [Burkholderiaceae bacterium]
LIARIALPDGLGELHAQFEAVRKKLEAEGLLAPERKRKLPKLPRVLGVVTSEHGAALHDIVRVASSRCPTRIVVSPCLVQGRDAPRSIEVALADIQKLRELDVVIVGRGGGSAEDLVAFNDERVARAIAGCRVPVVSAVGHEVDFTIADFVADVRAPTPTGAATRAVPDRIERLAALARDRHRLVQAWRRSSEQREQRLDTAIRLLRPPALQWAQRVARLDQLAQRIAVAGERATGERAARLARLAGALRGPEIAARRARLEADGRALQAGLRARLASIGGRLDAAAAGLDLVSPRGVLARGYAIVTGPGGGIVRDAGTLAPGDAVSVALAAGGFEARVLASTPAPGASAAAVDEPDSDPGAR